MAEKDPPGYREPIIDTPSGDDPEERQRGDKGYVIDTPAQPAVEQPAVDTGEDEGRTFPPAGVIGAAVSPSAGANPLQESYPIIGVTPGYTGAPGSGAKQGDEPRPEPGVIIGGEGQQGSQDPRPGYRQPIIGGHPPDSPPQSE